MAKKKATKKKTTKKATKKKVTKKVTKKVAKKKTTKKLAPIPKATVKLGKAVKLSRLPMTSEKEFNLADNKGKKLVIFFYPKDSTPGCTVEGHDFTQLHSKFKKLNTEVLGASRDSIKSHENFKSKQGYSVELISDVDEKLCGAFGVIKLKNMYGNKVRGIERSTFVIDESGKLIKEWRGVKVPGHAQEVLEYIKSL